MDSFETLRRLQQSALQQSQFLEQSRLLRESLLPNRAMLEALRGASIPSALDSTVLRDVARAYEEQRRLGRDLASLLSQSSALGSASVFESTKWLMSEQKLWAGIAKGLTTSKLSAPQSVAAMLPATVWESSMRGILEGLQRARLPAFYPAATDRLLEPYVNYSRFARGTVKRIERADDPAEVNALSGALMLAEEHVVAAADLLVESVEDGEVEEGTGTLSEVPSRLLQVQRKELLAAPEIAEGAEYGELILASPSAVLAAKARDIIERIVWCNRQAQALDGEEIFKPTTMFIEALNTLPWTAVVSDNTLAKLVDCLYFILYEGAGKDNLRYLRYVQHEDCNVIFTIKHLRNKLYRHDVEHGSAGGIRKSYRDLRSAFETVGVAALPRRASEFQTVQRSLLNQIGEFLERLQDALAAGGGR